MRNSWAIDWFDSSNVTTLLFDNVKLPLFDSSNGYENVVPALSSSNLDSYYTDPIAPF